MTRAVAPTLHGALDYLTVAIFAVGPLVLDLSTGAATLSYLLAAVHLALTLVTRFPPAAVKLVPLVLHGWVELAVAVALAIIALTAFGDNATSRNYYLAIALVILAVWVLSDYQQSDTSDPARPAPA